MSSNDSDSINCNENNIENTNSEKSKNNHNNEINDIIEEYIKIDNLIKEKGELFNKKKDLEDLILKYLQDKKMESITVNGNVIKCVKKNIKEPIKKKDIKAKLLNDMIEEGFVKSDGSVKSHVNGNAFIQTMLDAMEKRPVSEVYKIERKGCSENKKTNKKSNDKKRKIKE